MEWSFKAARTLLAWVGLELLAICILAVSAFVGIYFSSILVGVATAIIGIFLVSAIHRLADAGKGKSAG